MSNITKNKNGFALTEILMSIAVILIVGIAGYKLYKHSKRDAEITRITNATSSYVATVDQFRSIILPSLPPASPSATNQSFFDLMTFLGNANLLNPDFFTNTNYNSSNNVIDGPTGGISSYYIKGTQWDFNSIANSGGYELQFVDDGNGSVDIDECVMLAQQLIPLFKGGWFQINYHTVDAEGVWVYVYGHLSPNVDVITSACAAAGNGVLMQIDAWRPF